MTRTVAYRKYVKHDCTKFKVETMKRFIITQRLYGGEYSKQCTYAWMQNHLKAEFVIVAFAAEWHPH